jgi:putative nucleotidyltransferase with HDIG domain
LGRAADFFVEHECVVLATLCRAMRLSTVVTLPRSSVFHFSRFLCSNNCSNQSGGTYLPTRKDAWNLVCEYTQSESLRKHMLAVETCVRAYARKNGADEELWGLAALLHDFDYERWPNSEHLHDQGHPSEGAKILRERGYSEEIIRAVLSHADYCNTPRQTPLEHTLFACDELAGFLTACCYVRPSRSVLDLEMESVRKKLKDKAFAKGVNREDVRNGAAELGVPLEEHISFCIAAMRENADALGLRGNLSAQAAPSPA